nr:head-tail connector protein [uncultured Cohaesibacter sp.]
MKFAPYQITAPDALPVTLDEIKTHCRVDGESEDDYLTGLLQAAVSYLDGYSGILGKCLMTQEWAQEFEWWGDFPLCLGPFLDLTSIAYFDEDGESQTVDLSSVRIERRVLGAVACLKVGASWPDADPDAGPITVTWRVGYEDAAAVPAGIRHAIKLMVGHWFENREAVVIGTITSQVPLAVDALLSTHRKVF